MPAQEDAGGNAAVSDSEEDDDFPEVIQLVLPQLY
jgi:hypothetical protein